LSWALSMNLLSRILAATFNKSEWTPTISTSSEWKRN
jgi:hypothetical protein